MDSIKCIDVRAREVGKNMDLPNNGIFMKIAENFESDDTRQDGENNNSHVFNVIVIVWQSKNDGGKRYVQSED